MRKLLICIILIVISNISFAQLRNIRYIELRASIDILGNIYIDPLETISKSFGADSLFQLESKKINDIIKNNKTPVKILNSLSEIDWLLISSSYILKDDSGRPNTSFLVYYLRKDFK